MGGGAALSLSARAALLMKVFKPVESRALASCRHGTDGTGPFAAGDGFFIWNVKYFLVIQRHSITKPASGIIKYFI
jgi:hypothetical protein